MLPFEYKSASNQQGALAAIANNQNAKFIAGGTTLLDLMKLHVETPSTVVNIQHIPLQNVKDLGSVVEVGALVTNNAMAHHKIIAENFPVVSEAILSGASVQLRNMATTAGNLLQRTRCAYFRDTANACNKREPGSGCAAIGGFTRMNAVLGTSASCIAAHPSDMAVALMALETSVVIHSNHEPEKKPRVVLLSDFYKLPGSTPHIENVLRPGDLITAIHIPKISWYKNSTYLKIRDRSSYAFALASAAVALDLDGKTVRNIRMALGGVGSIPWRAIEAEQVLRGQTLTKEKILEAAKATMIHSIAAGENAFKIPLGERTIARALCQLGGVSWT